MLNMAPTAQLDHFFRVSRLLAGQLDFRSAIRSVATEVAQVVPYDHLDVCIAGADGRFHSAYETGIETAWGSHPHSPVANSPIRALLSGGVPHLLADDATTDPRFNFAGAFCQPIHDHCLRSRIHAPMRVHGEIIGALSCSSKAAARYTMQDVRNIGYIADLLSPYFYALRAAEQAQASAVTETEARAREEGLRLGALRLTEALEQERQRIGMDLHDQTLADLTRLARRLDGLTQVGEVPPEALEPLSEGLHRCMQDLRQIIEDAKPSVLHLFGFAQAVESHLNRSIRDAALPVRWQLSDDTAGRIDDVEPTVRIALFRILQEAINNAVHHSAAKTITVTLRAAAQQIDLNVTDDGKGLGRRRTRIGSGIDNMKTRARLISARFQLGPADGGCGTAVHVCLPSGAEMLRARGIAAAS